MKNKNLYTNLPPNVSIVETGDFIHFSADDIDINLPTFTEKRTKTRSPPSKSDDALLTAFLETLNAQKRN